MLQNSNSSSSKEFQYLDINKRLVLCMPCNCYCISGSNNFSLPGMYRRALALCIDAWKLKLKNNWRNLIWNPPSCSVFTSHLQSPGQSSLLVTEFWSMVSVKAGHGEIWPNFLVLQFSPFGAKATLEICQIHLHYMYKPLLIDWNRNYRTFWL